MRNHPRRAALTAAFAFLAIIPAIAVPPAPAPEKPAVAAPAAAEKPAENFPITLQGFFGTDANAEASLRLRDSEKSSWVKPGDSFGGWKLESVSTRTGTAILTAGTRRVALRLAGESGATPAATRRRYTSSNDSIVLRRNAAVYRKHPEVGVAFQAQIEHTMELLAQARPDLVDPKTGKINTAAPAVIRELDTPEVRQFFWEQWRQFVTESTEPGIVATREGQLAYIDAQERVKRRDDDGADLPAATPEEREQNKAQAHNLRVLEEADRLYLSRGGNPDTSEYDQMQRENEARQKAEEEAEAKPTAEAAK